MNDFFYILYILTESLFLYFPKSPQAKRAEDKYLSETQLLDWFKAVQEDYDNEDLAQQDYVLFWATFFLSDRKSETYALHWKHIDFTNNKIYLNQALDKFGNVKSTKGNKSSELNLSVKLKQILIDWKEAQKKELAQVKIKQNRDQFLFTFIDRQGNINQRVHSEVETTKTYINSNNIIELTPADFIYIQLTKSIGGDFQKSAKKDTFQQNGKCLETLI